MRICLVSFIVFFSLSCYSQSEIYKALESNDLARIKTMFDEKPDLINKESENSAYPVFFAAEKLRMEIVRYFIEKGAKLDLKTSANGDNVILYLARTFCGRTDASNEARIRQRLELIDLFAGLKASFSVTDKDGHGPLYVLASRNNLRVPDVQRYMEIVNSYIKYGARFTDKGNACTLHQLFKTEGAAVDHPGAFGSFEAAKEFVALGADVNDIDADKNTPLHMVLLNRHAPDKEKADIVKFLIEKGASVKVKNSAKRSPEDLVKKESPLYEILKKTRVKK